jgi:hypothetical protein
VRLVLTRSEQVQEELRWFDRFRVNIGVLIGFPVTPQSPPEPDLAVETPAGAIGVELTELVPGLFQRSVETAQDGTVRRAEELFVASGGPPTFVNVYWRHLAAPRRPDAALAQWIADQVNSHLPPSPGQVVFDSTEAGGLPMDHPLFERIDVTRLAGDPAGGWFSPRRWRPGTVGPDIIQKRVDSKNQKPKGYVGEYAGIWLVISAKEAPSSGVMLASSTLMHEYQSTYDRVFLMVYSDNSGGELRLRHDLLPTGPAASTFEMFVAAGAADPRSRSALR